MVTSKIVVVTGGRNFDSYWTVHDKLSEVEPTLVVQGGCPTGADRWARRWCMFTGIPVVTVHPLWDKFGDPAGPIRNKWMFDIFDVYVTLAFPGGDGTADCIKASLHAGVGVYKCYTDRAPDWVDPVLPPRPT